MAGNDLNDRGPAKPEARPPARRPYLRPQIAWREAYEPVAFGISCALQPGNPGCVVGPSTA